MLGVLYDAVQVVLEPLSEIREDEVPWDRDLCRVVERPVNRLLRPSSSSGRSRALPCLLNILLQKLGYSAKRQSWRDRDRTSRSWLSPE